MRAGGARTVGLASLMAASLIMPVHADPLRSRPLQAVVPTRVVHPGQALAPADLRVVTVRNPNPVARPVVRSLEEALGRVATRTLLPRRYIARASLRSPHAIEAGRRVELRYRRGALAITMRGTALGDAALGHAVAVRVRGGRTVTGTVAAGGVVEVAP